MKICIYKNQCQSFTVAMEVRISPYSISPKLKHANSMEELNFHPPVLKCQLSSHSLWNKTDQRTKSAAKTLFSSISTPVGEWPHLLLSWCGGCCTCHHAKKSRRLFRSPPIHNIGVEEIRPSSAWAAAHMWHRSGCIAPNSEQSSQAN